MKVLDIDVELKYKKETISAKATVITKEKLFDLGMNHITNFNLELSPENVIDPEKNIQIHLLENIQYRDKDRFFKFQYNDETGKVNPFVPEFENISERKSKSKKKKDVSK